MKKSILAASALAILIVACKTKTPTVSTTPVKPAINCTMPNASYVTDIKPILEQYCTRCHGNAGGYDLRDFADVTRAAKNGDLLGTIKWQDGFPTMPARGNKLDQNTIDKIECWINNGLKP